MNVNGPCGAMPSKPLNVEWLLYDENIWELTSNDDGFE
jgi:hypothetical protein